MTKQAEKYIKENLPYYGKLPYATKRGKDTLSRKTWMITSQYVRMRDFIFYGYCVSCLKNCPVWEETDPAHYHTFAGNGALSAFNLMNIHMSCKTCNGFRGAVAGHEMAEELKKRYGGEILNDLSKVKHQTTKADDWFYIAQIEEVYGKFQELKKTHTEYDFPDYL